MGRQNLVKKLPLCSLTKYVQPAFASHLLLKQVHDSESDVFFHSKSPTQPFTDLVWLFVCWLFGLFSKYAF